MSDSRAMSRRSLLGTGIGGLSALAITQGLGSPARAKPTSNALSKSDASTLMSGLPVGVTREDDGLEPEQRKLARLLLNKGKRAFADAAAHPTEKFHARSLHAHAAAAFARLSPKRLKRARAKASALLTAASTIKLEHFGIYGDESYHAAKLPPKPDPAVSGAVKDVAEKQNKQSKPKQDEGPKLRRFEIHLNSVRCNEETDEVGADELMLGGHVIEPNGNIVDIGSWLVYDDFDQGEVMVFDWSVCRERGPEYSAYCPNGSAKDPYAGRRLVSSKFPANTPASWAFVLVAGEQDDGGFGDLLNDFYAELKDEIDEAVVGLGGAVGSVAFSWLGPIGSAIGAAIGAALSALFEWFMNLWDNQDDFIAARSRTFTFKHNTEKHLAQHEGRLPGPKGVIVGEMNAFDMVGDGGSYRVRYHWRVFS